MENPIEEGEAGEEGKRKRGEMGGEGKGEYKNQFLIRTAVFPTLSLYFKTF